MTKNFKILRNSIVGAALLIICFFSVYTVDEGHVGIVKRFSQAYKQVDPGLHVKMPFFDSVHHMEIRTRRNEEAMSSSTSEQMPVTVNVSVNWTVDKSQALHLYKKYGGLSQFESRILDTRTRSVAKQVIPKFTAESLIQDRSSAIMKIEAMLIEEMGEYPVTVDNIQIDNIKLPPVYIASIQEKQAQKNLADAEKHKLEKQRLESLREVNTADAKAQGILKVAAAEAEAVILKGEAEAKAIKAKAKALKDNPLVIELAKAKNWDGKLPHTVLGESVPMLKIGK